MVTIIGNKFNALISMPEDMNAITDAPQSVVENQAPSVKSGAISPGASTSKSAPAGVPNWADRTEKVLDQFNENMRFFMMRKKEGTLKTVSSILIHKTIQGIVGEMQNIKRMNSGDMLIEVKTSTQAKNLLKLNLIGTHDVTISPHYSLNTSRGVISEYDLLYDSENDIHESLMNQNVTSVHRITIRREGQAIPTKHLILTFSTPSIPNSVKIAYLNSSVRPYIPNPLRCFKCQRFGHSFNSCRGKEICAKCSVEGHKSEGCSLPPSCINCRGNHPSYSRSCPKFVQEKEIQTLKVTNNISFPEARRMVTSRTPTVGVSYSSVLTKQTTSVATQTTSIGTQTDPLGTKSTIDNKLTEPQTSNPKTQRNNLNNKVRSTTNNQTKNADTSIETSTPINTAFKTVNYRKNKRLAANKLKEKNTVKRIIKPRLTKKDFLVNQPDRTDSFVDENDDSLKVYLSAEESMLTDNESNDSLSGMPKTAPG